MRHAVRRPLPLLAGLVLLAPAATAAPSSAALPGDATLTSTGGILDPTIGIGYSLEGDPGDVYFLLPSFFQTTIPIGGGLFWDVGTELANIAIIYFLDFSTGTSTTGYALPDDPFFSGFHWHTQFFTFTLSPFTVEEVSNYVSTVLARHGDTHPTISLNVVARQGHSVTALDDGTVLVAGGDEPDGMGGLTAVASMELFDDQKLTFAPTAGSMTSARSTHTATLLDDGRVLLAGGYAVAPTALATAEIYDPATGTTTAVASMSVGRTQHTATQLADGRVFVAGGAATFDLDGVQAVLGSISTAHLTTEIYDPVADTWTPGPNLPYRLFGHTATLMKNGDVLIAGGVKVSFVLVLPIPTVVPDVHVYHPGSNTITSAAGLATASVYHGAVAIDDGTADGKVVVVGGVESFDLAANPPVFGISARSERYDPTADAWSPVGSLTAPRAYPNLVLTDDLLVVVGGLTDVDLTTGTGTPETLIETAPHDLSAWTSAGSMLLPREVARSVPVDGGRRILTVGTGDNGMPAVDRTAEMFVP